MNIDTLVAAMTDQQCEGAAAGLRNIVTAPVWDGVEGGPELIRAFDAAYRRSEWRSAVAAGLSLVRAGAL